LGSAGTYTGGANNTNLEQTRGFMKKHICWRMPLYSMPSQASAP
jgi:hypothetical protein